MKKDIEVKICCGTNCYIMGGSELHMIKEQLASDLAKIVTLKGENCTENCHNFSVTKKPPLAWINGEIMESATLPKLAHKIKSIAKE